MPDLLMKRFKRITTTTALSITLLLAAIPAFSQTRIISPYSMFGPGELKGYQLHSNLGMGGIAQGIHNSQLVNYANPASYAAFDSTSFVFDLTIFSHFYQQENPSQKQMSNYSSLGNFNVGFRLKPRIAVAAGIMPYSQLGYKVASPDPEQQHIQRIFEGSGGINRIYAGSSFKLHPNLSLGINASYLFGKTENDYTIFSDSVDFYRVNFNYADNIDGLMLSYGLQWKLKWGENKDMMVGATYTPATNLKARQDFTIRRDLPSIPALPMDTLSYVKGNPGDIHIPAHLSVGFMSTLNANWRAGMDFSSQNWEKFTSYDQKHQLNESWQLAAGAAFRPSVQVFSSFFSRMEYRMGMRYGQSFLNVNDNSFNELGISFGTGIPVRRPLSFSIINLGFEYSQRASSDKNLISENFYRINVGFSIYERWFNRSKFY